MPRTATDPKRRVSRALGVAARHCPICSSGDLNYEFIVDGYPVCRCAHCTLLFLNPQPALGNHQDDLAGTKPMPVSVYEMHAANAALRLDQLEAYAGTSLRRLLMVDNDAFLTEEARRRQLDVVAVSSADVDRGTLDGFSDAVFDGAVLCCTLERLVDPEAALRALKPRLGPPGVIMVIAPTIDSRTARLFRASWWEFNSRNLHYFSADTLQNLLLKTGYGDPVIHADDSAVSLEYFRAKIPAVSSAFSRRSLRVLVWATPPFLRRRAFRSLNSRRVVFARAKPVPPLPTLSVIVPAYNERATFSVLMDRLLAKSIEGLDIEIVLVESNSSDGTREDAVRYGTHPRVKLILQDRPRGKGYAVRAGLAACRGDIVLFQDADLEYDIDDYDDLIAPILAYRRNFVIGSRHVSKGRVWKIRQFNDAFALAAIFNAGHVFFLVLFNFMYRQRLKDPFSMFKVFRRECLYGLSFECDRFDFDFEIVIKLLRKGYRPLELPVNYRARSPSDGKKVSMLRDPLTWMRALLKIPLGSSLHGRNVNSAALTRGDTAVLPRLVIGYIVALVLIVPLIARSPLNLEGYTIAVRLQSALTGHLQVFYDTGSGFSEPQSAFAVLQPSDEARDYRLRLPPGRYRRLRIDPGTLGGRYVIERIAILAPDGSLHAAIPIRALAPLYQIKVLERTRNRLVVEAPRGPSDPQLVYRPRTPVVVPDPLLSPPVLSLLGRIALLWLCATGVVWLIEVGLRRGTPRLVLGAARAAALCDQHRVTALCLTAALSTGVAMYPVLLLGRSLVAPNNNGTPLLYGEAPYAPGSTDLAIEDIRGSDVWPAVLQEVPHSNVQREALAKGEIPLWNRYNAGGRPLWGQGLTSPLDPLHWPTLLTRDPALGWDLKFIAHRVVFALGVGLAALAATGEWRPAVILAAASPFIGIYTYRLNHPAVFALTYAPWVLLAWFKLAAARDRRRRALASILLALSSALVLVAGTPKEAAVTLLAVEMIGTLVVLLSPGSWWERGSRLLAATVAGVMALLITTPHWLVFLETLAQSYTAYNQPYVQFAGQREAIAFFLGPLAPGPVQPGLHVLGLVLTLAAITNPSQLLKSRSGLACGIGAAVLAAIAFGALPASVIVRIPLLANIGHIHDAFLAAALPPSLVLCAFGAQTLISADGRRGAIVSVAVMAALCWLLINARLAADDRLQSLVLLALIPVAVGLPACFSAVRFDSRRTSAWAATGLGSCVLLLPGSLHANTAVPVLDDLLLQPRLRSELDKNSPAIDAVHRASTEPSRAVGLDWTLFAGSQALYELESIGGADALEVQNYRELVDAGGIWRGMVWATMVPTSQVLELAPLLDLLNVSFLITPPGLAPDGLIDVPVSGADRVTIKRRATAWPRAFFVDSVMSYVDAADLLGKVVAERKPLAAVQSSDLQALEAIRRLPAASGNIVPARSYKVTVNTTSFVVRAPGAGVAVLSETYLPHDFRATLNGQPAPYFRVNHAFKACGDSVCRRLGGEVRVPATVSGSCLW